jgi:succinate dehydrogenase / fumarate reductase cytochrome b subunit
MMDRLERPLSPHLQVYRWEITNTLSILHRLTGIALSAGAVALVYWLVAAASGRDAYASAQALYGAAWFKLPLFVWMLCFSFHLANGVRHLAWDLGRGFERDQIRATGWAVIATSVLLALAFAAVLF